MSKGFVLLECLIALAVIIVFLSVFESVFQQTLIMMHQTGELRKSNQQLRDQLIELQLVPSGSVSFRN